MSHGSEVDISLDTLEFLAVLDMLLMTRNRLLSKTILTEGLIHRSQCLEFVHIQPSNILVYLRKVPSSALAIVERLHELVNKGQQLWYIKHGGRVTVNVCLC